jgi:N-acyl-D-aspartate/D-glutamate deacylase
LLPSVEEAIQIGREAHIPVHIYHLKAAGQENWGRFGAVLKLIEKARDSGIDVTADVYPYVRNGIPLTSFLPPKYFNDGSDAILDRLTDYQTRDRIRHEMETTSDWENWYWHAGNDWSNVLIAEVPAKVAKAYEAKSATEVSRLRNEDP